MTTTPKPAKGNDVLVNVLDLEGAFHPKNVGRWRRLRQPLREGARSNGRTVCRVRKEDRHHRRKERQKVKKRFDLPARGLNLSLLLTGAVRAIRVVLMGLLLGRVLIAATFTGAAGVSRRSVFSLAHLRGRSGRTCANTDKLRQHECRNEQQAQELGSPRLHELGEV